MSQTEQQIHQVIAYKSTLIHPIDQYVADQIKLGNHLHPISQSSHVILKTIGTFSYT